MKHCLFIKQSALLLALLLASHAALAQTAQVHHVSSGISTVNTSAASGTLLYSALGQTHRGHFLTLLTKKVQGSTGDLSAIPAFVRQEDEAMQGTPVKLAEAWEMGQAIEDGQALEVAQLPVAFVLNQNYPNPFNPSTRIEFDLPASRTVALVVYDVMGRRIATLVDGVLAAGRHEVTWEAHNLPTGVYFYRITAGDFVQVRRMMLVK